MSLISVKNMQAICARMVSVKKDRFRNVLFDFKWDGVWTICFVNFQPFQFSTLSNGMYSFLSFSLYPALPFSSSFSELSIGFNGKTQELFVNHRGLPE